MSIQKNFTYKELEFIRDKYRMSALAFTGSKKPEIQLLVRKVIDNTSFLNTNKFKLRLWHILSDREAVLCCAEGCQNTASLNNDRGFNYDYPYRDYCSSSCRKASKWTTESFVARAKEVHGDRYSYEETVYTGMNQKVKVFCPDHGTFKQKAQNHITGSGCSKCRYEALSNKHSKTDQEWIDSFKSVHGDAYDYSGVNGIEGARSKIQLECEKHGGFEITPFNHFSSKQGCPKCVYANGISLPHQIIADHLDEIGVDYIMNDRSILSGKELDVVIPSADIAIEVNGVYWHSERFVDKDYHLEKTRLSEKAGYTLLHLFDYEIVNKIEIVKSMISARLGKVERIYARNCRVVELNSKESREFVDDNHLYGNVDASIRYGLSHKGRLVGVMTFSKCRLGGGYDYELVRYCNKVGTQVLGGASKLFSRFKKDIGTSKVVSYSDRRYSNGGLYSALGFECVGYSSPNYRYFSEKEGKVYSRMKFQKHKLKGLKSYSPEKSERDIMFEEGYRRVYDCGNIVWKSS